MWEQQTEGVDCGNEAGEWISKHLNKPGSRFLLLTGIHNRRILQQVLKSGDVELLQENSKV